MISLNLVDVEDRICSKKEISLFLFVMIIILLLGTGLGVGLTFAYEPYMYYILGVLSPHDFATELLPLLISSPVPRLKFMSLAGEPQQERINS